MLIGVWIFKKAKRKFNSQNSPYGFVHNRYRQSSRLHQGNQVRSICIPFHVHMHTGSECLLRGCCVIQRNSVIDQFVYGTPVAHYESIEVPFIAQNFGRGYMGQPSPECH